MLAFLPSLGKMLGMKLREYISAQRLTTAEFAKQAGASERAVIKWMRGERIPRPEMMARISAATKGKVTANDFFGTAA